MMNTKCNHSKGDMNVEAKSSSSGEEYDKVFNHLDMLNTPFERKVFTCAKQVKPYHLSPKVYSENSSAERRCQKIESYSFGSCSDNADIFKSSNLVHDKKPDLKFLRVFDALCYPTNDIEDHEKLRATADIRIFVGYAPNRKGYRIYNKRIRRIMEIIHVQFDELTEHMDPVHLSTRPETILKRPREISSRLVPNPILAAPYVPLTNKDLEILFQPMFDEYFEPPSVERPVPPTLAVQVPVVLASTPSSTTIDQDAPSTNKMAEENVLAPTRTDEQLVPVKPRLPIRKSNILMDLQKMQKNPIFRISVDIIQNINFFSVFTTSADVSSIYNQQFWHTLRIDFKTGVYNF
ncbi:retrovirus-related pol polyprotein from transposon TNT 1-94 [Tanacetum coccineum]|uniref:Retrovirus-related pol polyprotein from transposon TNT 1-94 n=1 Tax=Tanacetum coccineum TaxID=301880 RepID=A0ABQ4Z161_9ASTR